MINRLRIQNFKSLRDITLELTRVHVLIGPNDSGKTSILDAATALCRSVDHQLIEAFTGHWTGRQLVWHSENRPVTIGATISDDDMIIGDGGFEIEYEFSCAFGESGKVSRIVNENFRRPNKSEPELFNNKNHRATWIMEQSGAMPPDEDILRTKMALEGVHYCRWAPSMLALPVAPDSNRRFQMEPNGFGLALCLDDILGDDRHNFSRIETKLQEVFPNIESLKLVPEPAYRTRADDPTRTPEFQHAEGKGIYFKFRNNENIVPASQVSDGLLLVLAYLTLLNLPEPPSLILIEEPENGIHPKRLRDIVNIVKQEFKGQRHSQFILTTHSPYVLDLFDPEEVTLCRQDEDGAVAVQRMSESEIVKEQMDIFTLGEIWSSEGDDAISRSTSKSKK